MLIRKILAIGIIFILVLPCYGQYRMNDTQGSKDTSQFESVPLDSSSNQPLNQVYPQYWISAGFPGIKHDVGLNLMVSYLRSNNQILSVRYINNYNAQGFPLDDIHIDQEISLLYGLATDIKFFQASTSVGLGLFNRSFIRGHLPAQTLHFGIPLSARVSVNLPIIGIGIQGNAFISKYTYYGGNIFIELGKLW